MGAQVRVVGLVAPGLGTAVLLLAAAAAAADGDDDPSLHTSLHSAEGG